MGGLPRLNAPRLALPLAITPVVLAMSEIYPDLAIEVTSDQSLIDIVASGYDAGVRLAEMIARAMLAVRLTPPFPAIMVAAPSYLDVRKPPRSISRSRPAQLHRIGCWLGNPSMRETSEMAHGM